MGYDMYTLDQVKAQDAGDEGELEGSYFRANIWGMRTLRRLMRLVGVLDLAIEPEKWPTPPEELKARIDAGDKEASAVWEEQLRPFRGRRSPDPSKVPLFKFCSNDSWWVTPEECELLSSALRKEVTDEDLVRMVDLENQEDLEWMIASGILGTDKKEIERKLEEHLIPKDAESLAWTRDFGLRFADYCAQAALRGGFEVR